MPKLTRLHLSGIGHKDAKFNRLSLRFTDARNQPAHTLLWLPNGGGKSLLIAFKYAALRPHKRDFLGLRTGRGANLEDFVAPGKLAVVLMEFDFSEAGGDRRVIGYAALRKEQGLERTYFSFRAHAALAWETLPVAGLGLEAPNLAKLLTHFRQAAEKDKGRIAYFETAVQTDWEVHLRDELKLDPEIFGHHLVMNSDEGGVTRLFAKKSIDEFMQLFLQLALEHESLFTTNEQGERVDQVRQLVADYKRMHRENPRRDVIRQLCNELLPVLKKIQAGKLREEEIGRQLAEAEAAGSLLLRSVAKLQQSLAGKIVEADQAVKESEEAEKKVKARRNQLRDWTAAYNALYNALYFEEADAARTDAATSQQQIGYRVRVLEAAQAAARKRTAEQTQQTLLDERRAKLEKLEPDLKALQTVGGKLRWILHDRAGRLATDEETFQNDQQSAHARRSNAETALMAADKDKAAAERELNQVNRQQADLRQRRNHLRAQDWLNEGETAVAAAERWRTQVEQLEKQLETQTQAQADRQAAVVTGTRRCSEAQIALNSATAEKQSVDAKLNGMQQALVGLRRLPAMAAIAAGRDLSPWNDSLAPALERRRGDARLLALRLRVEGAGDERIIAHYHPPDAPLFPAPPDLEIVRTLLKQQKIEALADGFAHLDAGFSQSSDAEARLRAAPAEWSGLIIPDPQDFERARKVLQNAPITRPVLLVSGAWVTQSGKSVLPGPALTHAVLPSDRGMWNRAQARADIHLVEQRNTQTKDSLTTAESEEQDAIKAGTALTGFLDLYPKARVDEWTAQVDGLSARVAQTKAELERARGELAAEEAGVVDARQQVKLTMANLAAARPVAAKLRDHVKQYESRSDEWNAAEAKWQETIRVAIDRRPLLEQELKSATDALPAFRERRVALDRRQLALTADQERLTEPFAGKSVQPEAHESADALWERFDSACRLYEAASDDKLLEHRLKGAAVAVKAAKEEFDKATRQLTGTPWTEWMQRDDLGSLLAAARTELKQADSALTQAETVYNIADNRWPRSERSLRGKERIDPERPAASSYVAEKLRDECDAEAQAVDRDREALDVELAAKREARAELKQLEPKYARIVDRAPKELVAAEAGGHPEFSENITEDDALASRVFGAISMHRDSLRTAGEAARKVFEDEWLAILNRDAYTRHPLDLRKRLFDLGRTEIELDPAKHLKSLTGIKDACDDQVTQLAVHRASLVVHLAQRATLAAKRLKALQTESYLPKELDSWGGQPFLRVDLSVRNDEAERSRHLGDLVEKWAREGEEDSLPSGHVLAFACLKAVLASSGTTLKILKPTQRLEFYYHEITELAGFSEGQRVTAAILIYSILVRLRQKQAGSMDGLPLDAGYLLLDNPLGKANHTALVDLQLRIAKAMGLQLIYASGINDPGALVHFGHILRLKNTALDPRTGDKLVQADTRAANITGVELGVQPRAQVPPLPPKPTGAGHST